MQIRYVSRVLAEPNLIETVKGMAERGIAWTRHGPGVLGMNTRIVMTGLAVLAVIAWGLAGNVVALLALVPIVVGVLWAAVHHNSNFARKNPHLALMDSTELLQFMTTKPEAKGELPPASAKVLENPEYKQIEPPAEGTGNGKA